MCMQGLLHVANIFPNQRRILGGRPLRNNFFLPFPKLEFRMQPTIIIDLLVIIILLPFMVIRALHWILDRGAFQDRSAVKSVDSFYSKFRGHIKEVLIRPGRSIMLLHIQQSRQRTSRGLILLIHGSCARMQQFEDQIQFFVDKGYDVISYDALGCGRSAKPAGPKLYTSSEMYADFQAVLDDYVTKKVIKAKCIIGHSIGGSMVLKLAASPQARSITESVISLCPPSFMSTGHIGVFKLPAPVLWLIRPLMSVKARELLFGPTATDALKNQEREASSRNPVHMFKAFYLGIDPYVLSPKSLGNRLEVPTLIFAADHDKICPSESVLGIAENFTENPPHAEILEGCGHQCMQEQPDLVNKRMESFLKTFS